MSQHQHVLEARELFFQYRRGEPVLRGVDLTAAAGRFTCLLGPNGSGKTTLLRCLLGWLDPQKGTILLDGEKLREYSRRNLARALAYVPQQPRAAFAFNVQEIVMMGRFAHVGMLGLAGESDLSVAALAMEMTHTKALAGRTLGELSGGEAQRVMIARAIVQQPSVMLLDEPTSHLDIRNQLLIYRMMQRLAHDWQMAIVCVSHDVNLAARFSDQLVVMRDGAVLAAGPPGEVVCRDVLSRAYDVEIDLIHAADQAAPLVRAR